MLPTPANLLIRAALCRLCVAAVGLALVPGGALLAPAAELPASAQSDPHQAAPPALAVVWRIEGRKLDAHASAWSIDAYSTDGALVGIADASGTRILRASTGELVRTLPAGTGEQYAYSLAIAADGSVAIGRVGTVELHGPAGSQPVRHVCAGGCGPVYTTGAGRTYAALARVPH